jgi:hypothetical protein
MSTKVVSMKNVDENAILQAVYSKGRVSGGLRALSRLSLPLNKQYKGVFFLQLPISSSSVKQQGKVDGRMDG